MSATRRFGPRPSLLAVAVAWAMGCGSPAPPAMSADGAPAPDPRIALGAGDGLEIKFFYAAELNEQQTVRPDGRITLQLIGDVDVRGMTPAELRAEIVRRYTGQLRDPEVAVIVQSLSRRRVFVGGAVLKPGAVSMPGTLTVLEAVIRAGGLDRRQAAVDSVLVIRHFDSGPNARREGRLIDLSGAVDGKPHEPFYLRPRDVVYVPRTTIAKVDQWIDQHIHQVLPRVGFYYTLDAPGGQLGVGASGGY